MLAQFSLILSFFFFSPIVVNQMDKTYVRHYSKNGNLQAEGWQIGTKKTAYWIHYHPNGAIAKKGAYLHDKQQGYWFFYNENNEPIKEGHYRQGKAENWWVFYNKIEDQTEKYQYRDGQKEGYCFYYRNKKLFKAEKYEANRKMKEWTNLASFIQDHPKKLF